LTEWQVEEDQYELLEGQCFAVREVGSHHIVKVVRMDRQPELAGSRWARKDWKQEHRDSLQVATGR